MSGTLDLKPGSREPATPDEVDRLLTYVPVLSFLPELERCVPSSSPPQPSHEAVDAHFEGQALADVLEALRQLQRQAERSDNGGMAFLARTMLHFAEVEPVARSAHPLLVALHLRGVARASGGFDTQRAVAKAMNLWE